MHDVLCVRVAQGVGQQTDGRKNVLEFIAGDCADVRAVDKLQAVESQTLVLVEFEDPHDVRMHQPQVRLPLLSQTRRATGRHDLERDGGSRQTVLCQPGRRVAATAERRFERIPVS